MEQGFARKVDWLQRFVRSNVADARYRLLTKSDVINEADEVLCDDAESWQSVPALSIGIKRQSGFLPVRRKLSLNT